MAIPIGPLIALVFIFYLSVRFISHHSFSPSLFKVPAAHPTAHLLPLWIWWRRRTGRESQSIMSAHERLGPVVRLGPNEVSVASQDGLRKIYIGGFERTDWFQAFRNYDGTVNLVTMADSQHALRRRILSHFYSKSYLLASTDFQCLSKVLLIDRLLPLIRDGGQSRQGIDVFELNSAVAADMMSAYEVGIQNCLDLISPGREASRKRHVENGTIKLRELKGSKRATQELEKECLESCAKAEDFLKEQPATDVSHSTATTRPIIYAQLRDMIPSKEGITNPDKVRLLIASELIDSIEAARVGIGITLTYVMYQLSMRPAMQSALRDELKSVSPLSADNVLIIPASVLRGLDGLPLLDSIVMETLRLHSPAPGPQRRAVPTNGVIVDDHFIPAGVVISSSPRCFHRRGAVYTEADDWKPERWIEAKDNKSEAELRRWFWAFGSGGRMCIGNNFALLASKLVLASIYTNFTSFIIDDTGIEQLDEMPANPAGNELILGFESI